MTGTVSRQRAAAGLALVLLAAAAIVFPVVFGSPTEPPEPLRAPSPKMPGVRRSSS